MRLYKIVSNPFATLFKIEMMKMLKLIFTKEKWIKSKYIKVAGDELHGKLKWPQKLANLFS